VELLVALGIMTVLLSATAVIFNETSTAISTGIQNAKVLANTRTISDQMGEDFDNMLGPGLKHPRGFLVIVNQRYENGVDDNGNPTSLKLRSREGYEYSPGWIRTDQIAFIAQRADSNPYQSLTPGSTSSYATNASANYARIWYGHLSPTTGPRGTMPERADQWTLGRQALLLDGNGNNTPNNPGPTESGQLYGGFIDAVSQSPVGPVTLRQITGYVPGGATTPSGTPTIDPDETQDYLDRMYLGTNGDNRLQFLPDLQAGNPSDPYAPSRVAQLHPHLAGNVSDFIVEFAADRDGNGRIDRGPDGEDNTGNIYWYDAFDGAGVDANARDWTAPNPRYSPDDMSGTSFTWAGGTTGAGAFVFQYNDVDNPSTPSTTETSVWPYMIRIRYRVHDDSGQVRSSYPPFANNGRDDDGDGDVDLADGDTDEATSVAGRWFEHVFKVPRPGS
jgi:hypothetical protein